MENGRILDVGGFDEQIEIKRTWNPLTLADDRQAVVFADAGKTVGQVIDEMGLRFTRPYYVLINGEPWGPVSARDIVLKSGDLCRFVELPRGGGRGSNPLRALAMIAVVVGAPYLAGAIIPGALMGASWAMPTLTGVLTLGGLALVNSFFAQSAPSPDTMDAGTTYSISSGSNQLKIDHPFAENFGRLKVFPDLAKPSYIEYDTKNVFSTAAKQYLYFLGIVGVGEHEVEGVFIDDTAVASLQNVSYAVLQPGQQPTITTRLVWPCDELHGQSLNQEWDGDWTPSICAVNPPGTQIDTIEWDMSYPAGCYYASGTGSFNSDAGILFKTMVRLIDDDGAALSDWVPAVPNPVQFGAPPYSFPYNEGWYYVPAYGTRALYASVRVQAPLGWGRYEFSHGGIARGTSTYPKFVNTCVMGQVRGYGKPVPNHGDVTRLEMRIMADAQVNGSVANRINVVCTRKLYPVTATGFSSTKVATRSIVDAAAYIVTSDNGGRQDDNLLDFDALYDLRQSLETEQWYFDWRFQQRQSVMEAVSAVARCGKAIPYMPGGKFTLIDDVAQPVDTMFFTQDDYDVDSYSLEHKIRTDDSPTGIKVKYIDSDSWQSKDVECYDDDGSTDNMAVHQWIGIGSRQQAYDLGMWEYLVDKLRRSEVSFTTGLKGHLPLPGKRVGIEAPAVADWRATGIIQKIDGSNVYLSEPVDFEGEASGTLMITDGASGLLGPYTAEPGLSSTHVMASLPAGTKTAETDAEAAVKYVFGPASSERLSILVTSIQPQGQNSIRVSGPIYAADVYDDPGVAPSPFGLVLLDDPVRLYYQGYDSTGDTYNWMASWSGTATQVKVEVSTGGAYAVEQDPLTDHYLFFDANALTVTIKITPYDDGVLDDSLALTASHTIPGPVTGLVQDSFDDDGVSVSWSAVSGADNYQVQLLVDGLVRQTVSTTATSYEWTVDDLAEIGGPWADFTVLVRAGIDNEYGEPATLDFSATAPSAPDWLVVASVEGVSLVLSWAAVDGAAGYVLYSGATSDFDPATEGTLEYSGTDTSATVVSSANDYYKVAAYSSYVVSAADLLFTASISANLGTEELVFDNDGVIVYDNAGVAVYALLDFVTDNAGDNVFDNDGEYVYAE